MPTNDEIKILVIDDNVNCVDFLCGKFSCAVKEEFQQLLSECGDSRTLAEKILERKYANPNCVLFINVNLIVGQEKRQNHKGIELLTWLRIKEALNHCVLYSFQNAEAILRANDNNRLLISKGTTFIQLPNDFSAIELAVIANEKATLENLKTNIKPMFNVGKFRHRDANWWGVKQLWDVHRVATSGKFRDDYPQHIKNNLTDLNNAVGVFLNELDEIDLANYIKKNSDEIEKELNEVESKIIELEKKKSLKQSDLEDCKIIINGIWKQVNQINKTFMTKVVNSSGNLAFPSEKTELLQEIELYDTERKSAHETLLSLQQELKNHKNQRQSFSNNYAVIKENLFGEVEIPVVKKQSKILLIDDNADNGWKDIFSEILVTNLIESLVPEKIYKDRLEELYVDCVKPKIEPKDSNWDLIFLDLRLFDEKNRSIDIEDMSGKVILEKIKQDFRGIPVIITTASNKIWTFQKLINLGADGYWIKEGLDEEREAKDSAVNYCKLLFLVERITDGRYKLFREFSDFAQEFKSDKLPHWSTVGFWDDGTGRTGRVDHISESLNDAVLVLKNYLRNYHLNYDYNVTNKSRDRLNEAFVLSGLVNKIAGVYEDVHDLAQGDGIRGGDIKYDRGDDDGFELHRLRADQSHVWYNATWAILKKCIEKTMKYLGPRP